MKGAWSSVRFLTWVVCCSYYLFNGIVAKFTTHSISPLEAFSLCGFPLARQPLRLSKPLRLSNLRRSHL